MIPKTRKNDFGDVYYVDLTPNEETHWVKQLNMNVYEIIFVERIGDKTRVSYKEKKCN
jgi:hypothetical protein